MKIFLSGKYTGANEEEVRQNIDLAEEHAIMLWDMGFYVFCSHKNSGLFEFKGCKATYEDYIQFCLSMIPAFDALYLLPNWEDSPGALREIEVAKKCNIPIAHSVRELLTIKKDLFGNGLDTTLRLYDQTTAKARQRIIKGHKQYGMDWIDKDNIKEAKEELLDGSNYFKLELMKLEHKNNLQNK